MSAPEVEALLSRQVVYDGDDYSRQQLDEMVQGYATKHSGSLKSLEELNQAHKQLSREMTADLIEQKSAWECLGNIVTLNEVGNNMRALLERIPVVRGVVPDRPQHALLAEKVQVAQKRVQEVGNYLDRIQTEVQNLQADIGRLNRRMVVAAQNEESAARYVLELKSALEALEKRIAESEKESAQQRQLQADADALKAKIWEHGAKLRLYSTAENRLASIIRMNNNFLEILRNLHANMASLYQAGNEMLGDLEGNLGALASASKASELSLDLQTSMESLRTSANKVAVLASETSLYLTQHVDRMAKEMRVYDEATEQLVESNLKAEREIQEKRINETVDLAVQELKGFDEARGR